MRKLTKLEAAGVKALLDEVDAYLTGESTYELKPGYYPGWEIARKSAYSRNAELNGLFALQRYLVSDETLLALSLCFERPSRDWSLSVNLDGIKDAKGITQINIAKEYHGKGNGQYLIAERTVNGWAITASEYD